MTGRSAPPRSPRCPSCGIPFVWQESAQRPFCSLTCRLVDLGVWLDEGYRIPGEALSNDGAQEVPTSRGG